MMGCMREVVIKNEMVLIHHTSEKSQSAFTEATSIHSMYMRTVIEFYESEMEFVCCVPIQEVVIST